MEAELSFGAWVRRQRKALDLTQEQLAGCVGYSVPGLRKIESGERRPSRQMAELLADCLQVPPDQRPTFLQVARGQLCVERLTAIPSPPATGFVPAHRLPRPAPRLPTPPTPLVGREPELATLAQLLHDPQCRLLTLVGPGGIGKTRLALTVAATQEQLFPEGVYFVPLASLTSPELIVPAVADALGFVFSGPLDSKVQLLNYLHEKCLVLVLDSLEHLPDGAGLLADLLEQAPGVRLLVTSRERLNLKAEWLFDLKGLPVPSLDQLDQAEEYDAVALFVQCAARIKAGFVLTTEERPAVVRICQLVEGMPLAIELAAAWVRVLTCPEIEREIECNLDFLADAGHDTPGRHRSLRATFDYSWHLLSVEERRVLGRLAVLQGGFRREAAEQIAGATLPLLLALVSKSLVRRTERGCYDLHQVVQQYALVRLADEPEAETVTRDRHSDFYLALLRDKEKALKSADQQETIRELSGEIDNVRTAWAWTVEREKFGPLGPALRCFGLLFDIRGWYQEGIEQLELVVEALQDGSVDEERQTVLGQALAQEGILFFRLGRHYRAQNLFEKSIAILRPTGDPALLLDPLIFCGIVMYLNGQFDRAQSLLDEGLACAQAADNPWFAALAQFNLGYMVSCLESNMEAYEQMQAGLAIWRTLGDPRFIALGLNFLSPTAIKLGHLEEAQAFLQESLALCIQVGDRWGMGTAYRCLGMAALAQGDIPEAQCLIHYSLELFTELGACWDIARSLIHLGEATAAASDLLNARRILFETLSMAMDVPAIPVALDSLIRLAQLQARAGEVEQALELSSHVLSHPASTQEAKERAASLRAELVRQLTPQQIEAIQAQTETSSFDAAVTDLLETSLLAI